MSFKSKSQLRKFGAMVKRGEMSKKTFDEWLSETPNVKSLPERLGKKKKSGALVFKEKKHGH